MTNMGPIHHQELDDDAVTEGIEGSMIDNGPSISRCSTPDNKEDLCIVRRTNVYTGQHKTGRKEQDSEPWIGYHRIGWPSQEYSPRHPTQQVLNILHQQQQQQQQHLLSQSSSWLNPSSMSSLLREGPAFSGGEASTDSSSYSEVDSLHHSNAHSRSMSAARGKAISTPSSSGLVDEQSLPVTSAPATGVSCVPLPVQCVTDAIDINYQDSCDHRDRNLLKRKYSLSKMESASSSSPKQIHLDDSVQTEKKKRFARTTEALKKLGLWEIAMRTGEMIIQNRALQQELTELRQESKQLMRNVLKNPENTSLKQALLTMQAQFYARKHKSFENHNISIKSS
ncbi:uncharacterized protein LOC124255255 [Haliotis rubra]|uniref:uncharacterized protein LOC124255255 n=1 Tax=Haliotis rubra TaxID=36100 RepID=UPI001EE594C3|nr:uncharacterized protein LOC124255255 [Haliotis rubra]